MFSVNHRRYDHVKFQGLVFSEESLIFSATKEGRLKNFEKRADGISSTSEDSYNRILTLASTDMFKKSVLEILSKRWHNSRLEQENPKN